VGPRGASGSDFPPAQYCACCTTARAAVPAPEGEVVDASQLLKGVLDVAVLAVVRDADGYGYDVVRRLRNAGLAEVGDASVYGTLRRLFQAGALTSYVVASDEGPHRKYYAINDRGREVLEDGMKTWRTFVDTVDGVLAGRTA
jgi:PadR family transcriptional regulator, regulatory protein PadR